LARTGVLAHHRHRQRLASVLREDVADSLGQRVIELAETADARAAALAECVDTLSPLSREMLRRRYCAGKTVPEIAAHEGRSESALYKAFQKIHDALFQCIESKLARRFGL
jgi:RNA polymerase sigma-70 factor, ECF subfamily